MMVVTKFEFIKKALLRELTPIEIEEINKVKDLLKESGM